MAAIWIIIIVFAVMAGFQYYLYKNKATAGDAIYRVVKAGDVSKSSELFVRIKKLTDKNYTYNGQPVDASDYTIFIVDGNSMSARNIKSGDAIFVKELMGSDRVALSPGNIIVLMIESIKHTDQGDLEYKLRDFINYIKLNINDQDLAQWIRDNNIEEEQKFYNKLNCAKERHSDNIGASNFLCSRTWHNGELDYSFHPMRVLYGKVEFRIPKEKLP